MAQLIYVADVSLDGYIEDAHGGFEWTAPTDEIFTFITGLPQRRPHPVGAAGGAPVRQRCRVPPLPHPELTLQ